MRQQNYFNFDKQPDGLAMGARTSAILAEIYPTLEHKRIYLTLVKHQITGYFR